MGQNPVAESQSGNEDGKDGSWSDCQALEGAVALGNVQTESSDMEERVEGVEEEEGEEEEEGGEVARKSGEGHMFTHHTIHSPPTAL